jgi:FAD:protein FMN transferase
MVDRSASLRQSVGWRAGLLAAFLALLLGLAGCARPQLTQQESFVFGTQVQVTVAGVPEAQANAAIAAVLQEFDRLHRLLHAWQPSEITQLNAALAARRPHPVPAEIAALLREAQALAAASDYLFDPGIGRLIALWGFQSDEFVPRLPDPKALADWQRERPSIADLRLDGHTGNVLVSSRKPTVALDLGGYAKGVALDRAAVILRSKGVHNALINIGGNVLALGSKNGVPWRIGIKHPRQPGHLATLELRDGEAIGTSGDYQRYFELEGARYSHLLDPRSGRPAEGTQAVTILIPPGGSPIGSGTRSDALSKPLFIAGAGAWREMARRVGITHALRIDDKGHIEVSDSFAARLEFALPAKDIERFP